jgi:hypothetical protein
MSNKPESFLTTRLADLPHDTLLDSGALAELFGLSPRTLRRMVSRYELPPGIYVGGRKLWIAGKVLEYLVERAESLARDSAKRMARMKRMA